MKRDQAPHIRLQIAGILRGHRWESYTLRFSPNSEFIAAGSDGAPLSLWNVAQRERFAMIDVHAAPSAVMAFSPTQPLFAVPGNDGQVQVMTYDGAVLAALPGHTPRATGIAFLPSGDLLLTIDGKGALRVWEWRIQRVTSAYFVVDEAAVATLPELQDATHSIILAQAGKGNFVYGLALDPSGERLIINGYSAEGLLQHWKIDTGAGSAALMDVFLVPTQRDFVLQHRFSSDGRFLAALVTTYHRVGESFPLEERIELYQTNPFTLLSTIRPSLGDRWCVLKDLAFSPGGRYLVAAGVGGLQHDEEGTLWFWDVATGRFIASVQVHPDPGDNQVWSVSAVDWNGSGTLIATAGWEPSERGEMSVIAHLADQLVVKLWQVQIEEH
jgi:WD40 repeat protein